MFYHSAIRTCSILMLQQGQTIVCPQTPQFVHTFSLLEKEGYHNLHLVTDVFFGKLIPSGTRDHIIFVPKKIFDTSFYYKYKKASFFKNRKKPFFYFALLADSVIHTLIKQYFFSQAPTFCLWVRPIFGSIGQVSVRRKNK